MQRVIIAFLFFLALAGYLVSPAFAGDKQPVVVGSKIDTEGALLGKMIFLLLQDSGIEVVDKTEFGTTPIVRKAIKAGQIDIYPEYTGNGAFFFQDVDPGIWKNADQAYAKVKKLDLEQNGLLWLKPAPANNTWAIAVRSDVAQEHGLRTLEDFAEFSRKGGRIKLAGCEEFVNREDALPAFQKAYNFSLSSEELLVFSGCNTAQTEKAAARGTSGVNFAMAFGTDGALAALDLRVLADTKEVQPVYEPAPLVRREVISKYPRIEEVLNPVFASLDMETLQSLNARIAVQGRPAEDVARSYLSKEGWLQ